MPQGGCRLHKQPNSYRSSVTGSTELEAHTSTCTPLDFPFETTYANAVVFSQDCGSGKWMKGDSPPPMLSLFLQVR